jgi:hypothetical protein
MIIWDIIFILAINQVSNNLTFYKLQEDSSCFNSEEASEFLNNLNADARVTMISYEFDLNSR